MFLVLRIPLLFAILQELSATLIISQSEEEMVEGREVTVTCTLITNHKVRKPALSWHHIKHLNARNSSTKVEKRKATSVFTRNITFTPTFQHHGKHIQCKAKLPNTPSQDLELKIQYSPKETAVRVSGSQTGIREGDNITLSCFCRSYPPVTNYSWFRVGEDNETQFVMSSKSLSLGTVSRDQDNVGYYCRAENTEGAGNSSLWQINVEYGVEVTAQSKCTGGVEVECVCVVMGNPAANISWVFEDRVIGEDHVGSGVKVATEVRGHEARSILTVKRNHVEFNTACVGSNRHGNTRINFWLCTKGWVELLWIGSIGGLCGAFVTAIVVGTTCWLVGARRKMVTQVTVSTQERTPSVRDSSQAQVIQDTASYIDHHLPETSGNTGQETSENVVYCNIDYSKLPVSDGTVQRSETTDYAIIQLSPHQPPA